ncbi:hypothetical protein HY631_04500 [Candidatus Uhrbacteria bacterium]|nr:hypothetical protein [Candidatus Uhrbacteria bacterium]
MDLRRLVDALTLLSLGAIAAGIAGILLVRTGCAREAAPGQAGSVVVARAKAADPPAPTVVSYVPGPSVEEVEAIAERAARRAVAAERERNPGLDKEEICASADTPWAYRRMLECPEPWP